MLCVETKGLISSIELTGKRNIPVLRRKSGHGSDIILEAMTGISRGLRTAERWTIHWKAGS
jgi:hypothetical protein